MNKKVLSALLFGALMAGTGTFTSCIDNDEPAGIEQLRGAKAELVKAQAALTLADEAFRMAEVANQELLNEAQRLANKYAEIENEIHELDVELKRLEVEKAEAATEVAKAEAEAAIANAMLQKQQREQEMAYEAEMFKAKMLGVEKQTLEAQAALDKYLAEVELAKLTLTPAERRMLENAQGYLANCADNLGRKHQALIQAQKNFDGALLDQAGGMSLSKLTAELAKKNAALNVQEVLLKETEEMLALAKNFDEETWSEQMAKLDADIQEAKKNEGEAKVALTKIKVGAEYQEADDAYVAAVNELGEQKATKGTIDENDSYRYIETEVTEHDVESRKNYTANYATVGNTQDKTLAAKYVAAKNDSTAAAQGTLTVEGENITKFEIEDYESEKIASALQHFLNLSSDFAALDGYVDGVFSYTGDYYTEENYAKDLKAILEAEEGTTPNLNTVAAKSVASLEAWIAALGKFTPDANGQEWAKLELAKKEKLAEEAAEKLEEAVAAWQILADAVKDAKLTAAPQDTKNANIKKARTEYDAAVAAVATAVTAHNAAVDALKKGYEDLLKAETEKALADAKAKALETEYISEGKELLKTKDAARYAEWNTLTATLQISSNMDIFLAASVKDKKITDAEAAKAKATAKLTVDELFASKLNDKKEETNSRLLAVDATAKAAVKKDFEATKNSTLKPLYDAIYANTDKAKGTLAVLDNANKAVATKWAAVKTAYVAYNTLLAESYGQLLTGKNLTKIGETAIGKAAYVTYANGVATFNWSTIESDFGYTATNYSAKKDDKKVSVTYTFPVNEKVNEYFVAGGSAISDAEYANFILSAIDETTAKKALAVKGAIAYGTFFDWNAPIDETRLLEVTEAMVKAHSTADENNIIEINETNYGKLGAKMYADAQVALYEDMQGVDELVAPVKAELEAQLAALKAEIAANSAVVAEYAKAANDAWAAVLAGRTAVETALAARDEIAAEAQAAMDAAEDLALELNAIKAEAKKQLDALKPQNANIEGNVMSVEKLVAYWEVELAKKAANLENLKSQIAETEKAIELFEAGNYSEAYNVELYKGWLEAAQKEYEAAYAVYQNAVAEMEAILEALTK